MRVKCRSDGVIVPVRSCSGVSDVPVISPTGARCGLTNGERVPTAVVGAPGTLVGSAGDGRRSAAVGARGGFCCASAAAMLASSAPPAAAAAPAISVRRVIGRVSS